MRNDLEFYLPQLVTYMVFYKGLSNQPLNQLLLDLARPDFYFAHLLYWNLKSNMQIVQPGRVDTLPQVEQVLAQVSQQATFSHRYLGADYLFQMQTLRPPPQQPVDPAVFAVFTHTHPLYSKLTPYTSIYTTQQQQPPLNFHSTPNFFQDLLQISEELVLLKKKPKSEKVEFLRHSLEKMNQLLPANVYVPFFQNSIRNYVVLNIVTSETLMFNTKERVPFYLCLEIYRPEQDLEVKVKREKKMTLNIVIDKILKLKKGEKNKNGQLGQLEMFDQVISQKVTYNSYFHQPSHQTHTFQQQLRSKTNTSLRTTSVYTLKSDSTQNIHKIQTSQQQSQLQQKQLEQQQLEQQQQQQEQEQREERLDTFQDEDEEEESEKEKWDDERERLREKIFEKSSESGQLKRVGENSKWGKLQSWCLVHLIVKTGDNFKQEQLASQLVYQFNQIFTQEALPLVLTPYEVLSMSPTGGIIQMVKDAVTIDSLKQSLMEIHNNNHKNNNNKYINIKGDITSLNGYFTNLYPKKLEQRRARLNFCKSLAAYSLLCYFLQVKDRHNGNILIDREGHIIHIDFGFFISNSPGKGFEHSIPFKFNQEYMEVLKKQDSKYFKYFRKVFFQGFKAICKHQDKILVVVQMMYSGHGDTLPCFKAGAQAIHHLHQRCNPPVDDDGALNIFTQNLINSALNNYRTHWYDRFQYYFQGILY